MSVYYIMPERMRSESEDEQERGLMSKKTLEDCARCPVMKGCDAHGHAHGPVYWWHQLGIDPCDLDLGNPIECSFLGFV